MKLNYITPLLKPVFGPEDYLVTTVICVCTCLLAPGVFIPIIFLLLPTVFTITITLISMFMLSHDNNP